MRAPIFRDVTLAPRIIADFGMVTAPAELIKASSTAAFFSGSILLCGDVELNPGPNKQHKGKDVPASDTRLRNFSTAEETVAPEANAVDLSAVPQMLAELIKGQKRISQEITEIKNFNQMTNSRFDALEARVSALESVPAALPSATLNGNVESELHQLKIEIGQLSLSNDELENRSRRNNLLLHGFPEAPNETHDILLSNISAWFGKELEIDCPSIERCYRIGRKHADRPRPVIMKLLDYREKTNVLKNGHKLKVSDFRISEDFSKGIRSIRKQILDAAKPFRDNGSMVHFRFDHAFIDKVRYNWDDNTKTLVRLPSRPLKAASKAATVTS
ncbi:uncharacterized protein LOC144167989 [Haemaphysalis longicornis]